MTDKEIKELIKESKLNPIDTSELDFDDFYINY